MFFLFDEGEAESCVDRGSGVRGSDDFAEQSFGPFGILFEERSKGERAFEANLVWRLCTGLAVSTARTRVEISMLPMATKRCIQRLDS